MSKFAKEYLKENPEKIPKFVEACKILIRDKGFCDHVDCSECPGDMSYNSNACDYNGWSNGEDFNMRVKNAKEFIEYYDTNKENEKDKQSMSEQIEFGNAIRYTVEEAIRACETIIADEGACNNIECTDCPAYRTNNHKCKDSLCDTWRPDSRHARKFRSKMCIKNAKAFIAKHKQTQVVNKVPVMDAVKVVEWLNEKYVVDNDFLNNYGTCFYVHNSGWSQEITFNDFPLWSSEDGEDIETTSELIKFCENAFKQYVQKLMESVLNAD